METPHKFEYNMLSWIWLRRLFASSFFPYAVQAVLLLAFIGLAVLGWQLHAPQGVPAKLFAKSNLVNLVIWGLWWPLMVWVAFLFGRVWCLVCPLELLANGAERMGRSCGIFSRPLPHWLAAGWVMLAFFLIIQMCVAGLQLHRVPTHTSVFLWLLIAGAIGVSVFYRDRAFCRGFCPVGLLLNVYARGGMVAVRATQSTPCAECDQRGCTAESRRQAWDARSCPSLLQPPKLDNNQDCLVCGQCFKSCEQGNLGLWLRTPFAARDQRESVASWPLTLFVMCVSGFVIMELCSEWKAADALFGGTTEAWAKHLGLANYAGWVKGAVALFLLPLALWTVLGGLTWLSRGAANLADAWRRLALPLAVIVAAGHMAKGLAKFVSWAGFLPHAIKEPEGLKTAASIQAKVMPAPATWLSLGAVSVISVMLLLAAIYWAIREARLAEAAGCSRRVPAILLLGGLFVFLVAGWGWQR